MKKDKAYWDRYIKYLNQLTLLNQTKKINFITDREYIKMKRYFINKYKIQDYV